MLRHVRRRRWAWVRSAAWSAIWLLALLAALVLCPLTCTWLTEGWGHVLVERVLNQSPQARLAEYVAATRRGDYGAAMSCWSLSGGRVAGGDVRRVGVTQELLDLERDIRYRILEVQWWNNWCCEPCVAQDPGTANVAFLRVEVGGREYVFEARARDLLGNEPPGRTPVRLWTLADVYRSDGRPLDSGGTPPLWSYSPSRSLGWEEYDDSTWVTFRDEGWPIAFRHPEAWTVAVEEGEGQCRQVVVRARDRALAISTEPGIRPHPSVLDRGRLRIGSEPARAYVQRDVDGMLRQVTVMPERAPGLVGHVTYTLRGLPEDEDYARLFDTLLGTMESGAQRRSRVGHGDGRVVPRRDRALRVDGLCANLPEIPNLREVGVSSCPI